MTLARHVLKFTLLDRLHSLFEFLRPGEAVVQAPERWLGYMLYNYMPGSTIGPNSSPGRDPKGGFRVRNVLYLVVQGPAHGWFQNSSSVKPGAFSVRY